MRSPLHASSHGKIDSGISCHFVSDVTKGELCIPPPLLEKLVVVDRFLTNFSSPSSPFFRLSNVFQDNIVPSLVLIESFYFRFQDV